MSNIDRPTPKTDYQNFIWNTISFLCFVYLITFCIFMEYTKDKTPPKLTSETNNAIYTIKSIEVVSPDFARKLERERDEAREDAATYYARNNELKDVGNKLADECDRILGLGLHQNTLPRFKAALEAWRKNN